MLSKTQLWEFQVFVLFCIFCRGWHGLNACRTCSTLIFPRSTNQIRDYDDGNQNVTNLHIWRWKTIVLHALHVHFSFLFISQTFSFFPRREMTCFAVVWTTWAYDDKFLIFSPRWTFSIKVFSLLLLSWYTHKPFVVDAQQKMTPSKYNVQEVAGFKNITGPRTLEVQIRYRGLSTI